MDGTQATAAELRDAAERASCLSHSAAKACAAYIRATVQADDDQPIDEEWLTSIGCTHYDDGDYLNEHWKVGEPFKGFGVWEFNDTGEWLIKERDCLSIRTRGQLRTLCKVLGIPLPTAN